MKSKKLLSIILALAMMFSVLPASTVLVYADEITETISADTTWNDGDTVGGVTISGGTVTINGDVGITAAITIKGDVTFTGGGTLNRMSTSGNLIKVESGSLTLGNVTIDGNNVIISDSGAAAAINMAGGTVIMNDGAKITNHKRTSGYGPAVYMTSGNFKMKGGTISGCESRNYGGAIYLDGGSFEMNGGIIENNKTTLSSAGYGGGAFYVREATLIINDGLIQNNSSNSGGAIYNTSFGTTIINGGVIKGNTAVGDSPSGSAIFHSCKTTGEATLQIGGNANINVGNDIYLMSNTSATKYVEITSSIKNPLILAIEGESEGRVIADAADGVVLTYNDMAKIRLSNSSYALKLENNQIKLTQTSSGETKFPVYLGYDANNGTNAPNGSSAEIVAGNSATFTISDSVPTRTGYDFLGWSTNKDATSAEYSSGGSITISSNTTLYAVWKKISTFETNEFTQPLAITGWTYGETANTPTAEAKYGTIKYTYSNTADGTYTEEVPTNAGTYYVKATVEETADYSGLESNAVKFTILPKTINTAITQLTAPVKNEVPQTEIETDEYTATVVWSPEVTDKFGYNTVYTATITITPKTNYTVKGIAENGYTVSGAQTVTNEADSATITAVYAATGSKSSGGSGRRKRYTVSFNTNGGNKITSQTVAKDNSAKEPTAPIKENFEFAGWYTDKELTTKYDFTEKVTKSFTLYAKWTEQKQENGGSEDVVNNNSGNENKESSNTIVLTIDEHNALVYGTTKTNDVAPKVVNDRTMLPARFIAENLGATVEWDGEKQLVTITGKNEKQEDVTILITIGSDYAKVNGEDVKLDSPAFVENDRTYTPIRFISENLGATVEWNETEQTVTIQRVK